jgi:hypothetical protein
MLFHFYQVYFYSCHSLHSSSLPPHTFPLYTLGICYFPVSLSPIGPSAVSVLVPLPRFRYTFHEEGSSIFLRNVREYQTARCHIPEDRNRHMTTVRTSDFTPIFVQSAFLYNKVKLSLRLIKYHAVKMYARVEVYYVYPLILNLCTR